MVDQVALGNHLNEAEISNWIRTSKTIDSVQRLPGDASTRRYYRIFSAAKTFIVMKMDPFEDTGASLPFLEVQKHLKKSGIDVPEVHDFDAKRGFILLEDLGDITLLRKLQDVSNSKTEFSLYKQAIEALVALQVEASSAPKKTKLQAFGLAFDHEKLMWEVNFTIDNFYQHYLKRILRDKDQKILQSGFSKICDILAAEPRLLTHRDYHSRNLMIPDDNSKKQRMVMIDFQDARMGPAQYDLASLLKDSYYQLEDAQVEKLIGFYIKHTESFTRKKIDRSHFMRIFDLMAVQRNFKAIGSFASFLTRRGDPTYLKYIGNTFENIRRTLLKYPEYSELREVLFHYYYF